MQKIKQHHEKSWEHIFRMCARSLVKKGSKQERREAEKTLQAPAGNSLLLPEALLTQTCHGANACPGSRVGAACWAAAARCDAGAPRVGLARWTGTRRASESTREPVSLMGIPFILTCRQACRFSLQKKVSSDVGNGKKRLILDL